MRPDFSKIEYQSYAAPDATPATAEVWKTAEHIDVKPR